MAFELADNTPTGSAVIKVIGVGGGGGNAVNHMVAAKIEGSEQPQLAEIDKNVADVFDEDI